MTLALAPAAQADPEKAADAFRQLLAEHWARAQEEQVFLRTDPDAFRPDGTLPDAGPEGRARREAFNPRAFHDLVIGNRSLPIALL